MGRPRVHDDQRWETFRCYLAEFGPTRIWDRLSEMANGGEFGESGAVSIRTVKNWLSEFKRNEAASTEGPHGPFEWHRLEEFGLPWEASGYLLSIWAYFQDDMKDHWKLPWLSVRQAHWWWKVHLTDSGIGTEDAFWLAQRFVIREQIRDVLGYKLELGDLEAHLAYRPWAGEENRNRYLEAVKDGRILSMPKPLAAGEAVGPERLLKRAGLQQPMLVVSRARGLPTGPGLPEYPELLYSQTIHILEKRIQGFSEEEALQSALRAYHRDDDWYRQHKSQTS